MFGCDEQGFIKTKEFKCCSGEKLSSGGNIEAAGFDEGPWLMLPKWEWIIASKCNSMGPHHVHQKSEC